MSFEIVHQLDKEPLLSELAGRKFFVDLHKHYPAVGMEFTENESWSEYYLTIPASLIYPKNYPSISFSGETHLKTLISFKEPAENESTLSLEVRNLLVHFISILGK